MNEGHRVRDAAGHGEGQAEAVRSDVGGLLLYTPVVHPGEFDVAIGYLVRRLEEGASPDNFMSAVFELGDRPPLFERERDRFLASLPTGRRRAAPPHRIAASAAGPRQARGFENTPDTDPALAANRAGDATSCAASPARTPASTPRSARSPTPPSWTRSSPSPWPRARPGGKLPAAERAAILHRAGDVLEARRAELLEVMASETGKTIDQGDPEVSEAIDFAHYYAERARELDDVDGATFVPAGLTVVTPPWNFPVAIPAGRLLAALAAG